MASQKYCLNHENVYHGVVLETSHWDNVNHSSRKDKHQYKYFSYFSKKMHTASDVPHWGAFNGYSQHMFSSRNKKQINTFWLKKKKKKKKNRKNNNKKHLIKSYVNILQNIFILD